MHGVVQPMAADGTAPAPAAGESGGLILEGVHHAYDAAPVIRGVDLAVGRGEILCLLGPSGCGKTTLLRIAAGLERPRAGRVLIDGVEVAGPHRFVAPEKRRIGLMFQDYALFPHVRAIDNVGFGLKAERRAARRRRAQRLLERLGLAHLAHAYPHELSGGEQQRVALARALAPAPRAMLLDEPFSGLDERLRERVRDDTLRFLEEAGVPTMLVTHDAEEALLMADRIALMRDGVLVQSGSPDALCRRPASPFVARFFGALPAFDGRVRGSRGGDADRACADRLRRGLQGPRLCEAGGRGAGRRRRGRCRRAPAGAGARQPADGRDQPFEARCRRPRVALESQRRRRCRTGRGRCRPHSA